MSKSHEELLRLNSILTDFKRYEGKLWNIPENRIYPLARNCFANVHFSEVMISQVD